MTGFQYILNAFPLFAEYLGKLLLPVNLCPVHLFHPVRSVLEAKSAFSIIVTTAYFAIIFVLRRTPPLLLGFSIVAIPLLPAFYISAISGEGVFAERYLYLPTFGYAIVLAFIYLQAEKMTHRDSILATLIAAALIGIFSVGTIMRNTAWKDDHALWSDAVKKSPQSAAAHQYFGYALYSRGDIDKAIMEYGKALELDPRLFDARYNIGVAYHSKDLIGPAIDQYLILLRYHPGSANAHNALGMAYGRAGYLDQAIHHFQAALDLNPGNDEIKKNLHSAHALKTRGGGDPLSVRP